MKILNVNSYIDLVKGGGTAERTYQMSRFQAKSGHDVFILTTDAGIETGIPAGLEGVTVEVLSCLSKRFFVPKFKKQKLMQLIGQMDVIHLMGHWSILNAIVVHFAQKLHKPYVVCPAGALEIVGRSKYLKKLFNFFWGKKIIQKAGKCIAVTKSEFPIFKEYGIEERGIFVIPNGVDLDSIPQFSDTKKPCEVGLPENDFILFMGRLNSIKGPDLLLEAYIGLEDKLRDFDLVFAGPDGGLLDQLEKRCKSARINDKVHFLGYLDSIEKYQAYCFASVLAIPSRKEAMSIVAIEAGAAGTPVLLTDRCGFDQVQDVGGGFVVRASIDGLMRGLVKVRRHQLELENMGKKLNDYTIRNYSWTSVVNLYNEVYSQMGHWDK